MHGAAKLTSTSDGRGQRETLFKVKLLFTYNKRFFIPQHTKYEGNLVFQSVSPSARPALRVKYFGKENLYSENRSG